MRRLLLGLAIALPLHALAADTTARTAAPRTTTQGTPAALKATPGAKGKVVMSLRKATPRRITLMPGAAPVTIRLRGTGLDKLTQVRVAYPTKQGLVTAAKVVARIDRKSPTEALIRLQNQGERFRGGGIVQVGLAGDGRLAGVTSSLASVGLGATAPQGSPRTGAWISGGGARPDLSSFLKGRGAGPVAGVGRTGGATPELGSFTKVTPGLPTTVGAPKSQGLLGAKGVMEGEGGDADKPEGGDAGGGEAPDGGGTGAQEMSDTQSSDGSQLISQVDYSYNSDGTLTVTSETTDGTDTVVDSVMYDSSGKIVAQETSVNGQQVRTGGGYGGGAAGVSNTLEPDSGSARQGFGKAPLTQKTLGASGGAVDPNPEGRSGSSAGAGTAPSTGDATKGLGGDTLTPASKPKIDTMPKVAPSRGGGVYDPTEEGKAAPAIAPRTGGTGGGAGTPTAPPR